MVNSAKTPTGKARKGQVTVRPDSGSIKACFPRNFFEDNKQLKIGTGINPDNWEAKAAQLQRRLQLELEDGKLANDDGTFNLGRYREILEEYGLRAKLRVVRDAVTSDDQLPPKPELSLMEIWDMYCENRTDLRESVHKRIYQGQFKNFLKSAIEATKSEDAIKIKDWLVEKRNSRNVKKFLCQLSYAHQSALRQKLINYNPYEGLVDEIKVKGAKGKKQDEIETETDDDVLSQAKAYTWDEAQAILEYLKNTPTISHWYPFIKFKFLTGCRTGEAIGFMWCDVLWNKQEILIRRSYDRYTKGFYNIKTAKGDSELIRRFPMPKDGELWSLLKSIPPGEPSDVVFKSKWGKIISDSMLSRLWSGSPSAKRKGIISILMEEGKLAKYLAPYNTRHTFITHQIFDLGRDEKIVSAWCGHGEMVSQKHYQDIADRALQINPELPANQQQVNNQPSELELLKQQVRKQQELIDKLMKERE